MTLHYSLISGVEMNSVAPDTFQIPSEEARANLRPGDIVKLMFQSNHSPHSERMWVHLTGKQNGHYVGHIANDPIVVQAAYGDQVTFSAEHVVDIYTHEHIH